MTTIDSLVATDTRADYFSVIEQAIAHQPRTLQLEIGPSEIGNECEHCLAARLMGWPKSFDAAWLPFIGTSVHAQLEEMFKGPRWLTETRVSVGSIMGQEITGTSDLYDIANGKVIDHKIVGASTLTKAKKGPTKTYERQAQLYALGFFKAGYDVKNVVISYLPRNSPILRSGVWWEGDFKPLIAIQALDRAERLAETLLAFADIEERDLYIANLPRAKGCWDCSRYPDAPKASPKTQTVDSLLGL